MSVNEKMTAIADAIRDKTGGTEALTLDDMAAEIPKVYEEGKKAERDEFWEVFQNGGKAANYYYAFHSMRFTDANYHPKYDIVISEGTTTGRSVFQAATRITDVKVAIYANANNVQMFFSGATSLKRIPLFYVYASTTYSNTFANCEDLEELTMGGTIGQNGFNVQWSKKLNKASIESIVNALSATTSGLTVTLSKVAVNNAFTAEEWDALEATKTNWTISLV